MALREELSADKSGAKNVEGRTGSPAQGISFDRLSFDKLSFDKLS